MLKPSDFRDVAGARVPIMSLIWPVPGSIAPNGNVFHFGSVPLRIRGTVHL
jgi:hypothetical protein